LPDARINPRPPASGFVWDAAGPSVPDNGHCVAGVGYKANGVEIDSWGMTGEITDAAIAKYATQSAGGELYTLVSVDALSKAGQEAPSGFDWSQLIADFDSMGGNVSAAARSKASTAGSSKRGSPDLHHRARGLLFLEETRATVPCSREPRLSRTRSPQIATGGGTEASLY
jgi:hypothetical protein